jgi:hypothetical protein
VTGSEACFRLALFVLFLGICWLWLLFRHGFIFKTTWVRIVDRLPGFFRAFFLVASPGDHARAELGDPGGEFLVRLAKVGSRFAWFGLIGLPLFAAFLTWIIVLECFLGAHSG